MGQQETTMRATGSALRRMILVLAVAAVMAALVLASAVPAFAAKPTNWCVPEVGGACFPPIGDTFPSDDPTAVKECNQVARGSGFHHCIPVTIGPG
jgi:hypothetical protein